VRWRTRRAACRRARQLLAYVRQERSSQIDVATSVFDEARRLRRRPSGAVIAPELQETLPLLEATASEAQRYEHVFFSDRARCLGDVITHAHAQRAAAPGVAYAGGGGDGNQIRKWVAAPKHGGPTGEEPVDDT
jgi:hypothetical protein